MAESFNPYQKWLGIPAKDQPPHYYRLLGVELFEPDSDTISHAADRQMAHVRTFQHGQYSELSQQLLNQLARARTCLLDPQKRAQYDQKLRQAARPPQAEVTSSSVVAPPQRSGPLPGATKQAAPIQIATTAPAASAARPGKRLRAAAKQPPGKKSNLLPLVLVGGGVGTLAIVGLVIAIVLMSSGSDIPTGAANPNAVAKGEKGTSGPSSAPSPSEPAPADPSSGAKTPAGNPFVVEAAGTPSELSESELNRPAPPAEFASAGGAVTDDEPPGEAAALVSSLPMHVVKLEAGAEPVASFPSKPLTDYFQLRIEKISPSMQGLQMGSLYKASTIKPLRLKATRAGVVYALTHRIADFMKEQLVREGFAPAPLQVLLRSKNQSFKHDLAVYRRQVVVGDRIALTVHPFSLFLVAESISPRTTVENAAEIKPRHDVVNVRMKLGQRIDCRNTSYQVTRLNDALADWTAVTNRSDGPASIEATCKQSGDVVLMVSPQFLRQYSEELLQHDFVATSYQIEMKATTTSQVTSFAAYRRFVDDGERYSFPEFDRDDVFLLVKSATLPGELAAAPAADSDDSAGAFKRPVALDRKPVPDAAALAKARKQVAEVLSLSQATSDSDKLDLAEKAHAAATNLSDDPVARYAMFDAAWRMAAQAGNLKLAISVIEEMSRQFECDEVALRMEALNDAGKRNLDFASWEALVSHTFLTIDRAIADDQYVIGARLFTTLTSLARARNDDGLAAIATQRRKWFSQMQSEYRRAEPAFKTLATAPDDAKANLVAGRYVALVKGDWEKGLPLLAKGDDASLRAAATADLANPSKVEDQLASASHWFELGTKEKGITRGRALNRARHWYAKSVPQLSSLDKLKSEQRLKLISEDADVNNRNGRPTDGIRVFVFAAGDGGYELAVNGVTILKGARAQLGQCSLYLRAGDAMTVRATAASFESDGFAMHIRYATEGRKSPIEFALFGFMRYAPTPNKPWYYVNPNQPLKRIINAGPLNPCARAVSQATGLPTQSLYLESERTPSHFVQVFKPG